MSRARQNFTCSLAEGCKRPPEAEGNEAKENTENSDGGRPGCSSQGCTRCLTPHLQGVSSPLEDRPELELQPKAKGLMVYFLVLLFSQTSNGNVMISSYQDRVDVNGSHNVSLVLDPVNGSHVSH